MSLRERTRPGLGVIEPCLPSPPKAPPSGPGWIHGNGNDFTSRFPIIVAGVTAWLTLSFGTLAALGEGQKSECASGEARGRRGVGPIKLNKGDRDTFPDPLPPAFVY